MTKRILLLGGLVLALFTAGCGVMDNNPSSPDTGSSGYFHVIDVNVHGRTVPCITWKNANAGGLSCDWSK